MISNTNFVRCGIVCVSTCTIRSTLKEVIWKTDVCFDELWNVKWLVLPRKWKSQVAWFIIIHNIIITNLALFYMQCIREYIMWEYIWNCFLVKKRRFRSISLSSSSVSYDVIRVVFSVLRSRKYRIIHVAYACIW